VNTWENPHERTCFSASARLGTILRDWRRKPFGEAIANRLCWSALHFRQGRPTHVSKAASLSTRPLSRFSQSLWSLIPYLSRFKPQFCGITISTMSREDEYDFLFKSTSPYILSRVHPSGNPRHGYRLLYCLWYVLTQCSCAYRWFWCRYVPFNCVFSDFSLICSREVQLAESLHQKWIQVPSKAE